MQPVSAQSFTHICLSEVNLCLTVMDGFDHRLQSIMRLGEEVNLFIIIGHPPTLLNLQPLSSMHNNYHQKYSYRNVMINIRTTYIY